MRGKRPIWYDGVPPGFWTQSKNRRAFMNWLGEKLRWKTPEDWYQVTTKTFLRYGGGTLLTRSGGSIIAVVEEHMPWYDWRPWLFARVPVGFWAVRENCRRYLEWLGEELGYETFEDWYQVGHREFRAHRGGTILTREGSCISRVLREYFPEYEWLEWRFSITRRGFWADPDNRRRYLVWAGEQLGYETYEDWYQVHPDDFLRLHGWTLVWAHGTNPYRFVMSVFAEYDWQEWRFGKVSKGFFDDSANARRYMEWLRAELGLEGYEALYRITTAEIESRHGSTLLHKYGGSVFHLVSDVFSEYEFHEWCFVHVSRTFWFDPANCRRYLEWLGERLGYEDFEDWYRVTTRDFSANYGATLLVHAKGSILTTLRRHFPEHEWLGWRFSTIPHGFWSDPANCRSYLEWLGERLGHEDFEDWYQVTGRDFRANRGDLLLKYSGGWVAAVLKRYYPEYEWLDWRFKTAVPEFWTSRSNLRRYLLWLAEEWEFEEPEDWYLVRATDIAEHRGRAALKRYDGSHILLLQDCFPEYGLKEEFFPSRGYLGVQKRRKGTLR